MCRQRLRRVASSDRGICHLGYIFLKRAGFKGLNWAKKVFDMGGESVCENIGPQSRLAPGLCLTKLLTAPYGLES